MTERYEVLVGLLNLRAEPNGAILAQLPRAAELDAAGPPVVDAGQVTWLAVKPAGGSVTGYVCERFVARLDARGQDGPEPSGTTLEVTEERLRLLAPNSKPWITSALAASFPAVGGPFGILDNPRRLCHFLAQAAHESAGFRTLEEYGGPSYWRRYEGRADLGNTQAGDGVRYHGRGIFQLTGRANYRAMAGKITMPLEDDPDHVADPGVSLRTACEYWKARRLEAAADANDIVEVTRRVNGGRNGLTERQTYFRRAWSIWGVPGEPPGI